jgi:serine/threonine protein kinase
MIAGYPPFYDEDPMKTYGRIMSGQFSFPMHFSKQAMDLIRKLLNPKAGKRYGVLAGGATLIKNQSVAKSRNHDNAAVKRFLRSHVLIVAAFFCSVFPVPGSLSSTGPRSWPVACPLRSSSR